MSSFKRFMWCPWFFTISLKTNMFYEKLYPIIGRWSNQKNKCFNIQNCPTGISDCHNIISVTIKGDVPVQKRKIITYRSYKILILIALIVILRKFHSQILRIYQHLVKYTMYIMNIKMPLKEYLINTLQWKIDNPVKIHFRVWTVN